MRLVFTLYGLLACCLSLATATALTYQLAPSEKACFFTWVDQKNAKVAFYFAVQSGGSFDVDYTVVGPNDKLILQNHKERQGDFVFTAQETGEYRVCFDNEMSTFAEKMVDFELAVENESRIQLPSRKGTSPEQTSILEEAIFKVSSHLSTINRNQKYFRTRENRNFSTVRSTERRIFNFSIMESALMVCMAGLQVFIVRFFFQGARKGKRFYYNYYSHLQNGFGPVSSSSSSSATVGNSCAGAMTATSLYDSWLPLLVADTFEFLWPVGHESRLQDSDLSDEDREELELMYYGSEPPDSPV
ncbi:Transmembrane emp24 domain-containing protein 3 [Agyrium rufum]|nr:Transmembrane emp24 domain-containing protein 3 [Agyrium rufum]